MGTAIFTGVTGLLAHQRRLDIVANNISNVNTTGYRGSRVLFEDLFAQTLQGGTAPSGTYGGSNPMQVGLGSNIGAIEISHTEGPITTTGVPSDLAVDGTGFFVMRSGASTFYTRDGSFQLNSQGALIDPATGTFVQGYLADSTGAIDTAAGLKDIVIPLGGQSIVRATTEAVFQGNLSADAATNTTVNRTIQVYDSLGTVRNVQITMTKLAASGQWQWDASTTDTAIQSVTGTGTITFDGNGAFVSNSSNQIALTFDPALPAGPTSPMNFTVDFSDLSQLSGESDVTLLSQDGFERGVLESYSIGRNGMISGVFTNGRMQNLGQVALGTFPNLGGLTRVGNNMFMETPSSGTAQVGLPGSGGRGEIAGGSLEGSNVDLGAEFSNMIITQRGFQANARTITAADTLLQETVNLVR